MSRMYIVQHKNSAKGNEDICSPSNLR